jgi:hypothetical protein
MIGGNEMNIGLSDRIRELATNKYVKPAITAGHATFSIRVRDLLNDLRAEGVPPRNTPQICNALVTSKFLRDNDLVLDKVEGPPSLQSPTVVVHYRVATRERAPAMPVESVSNDPKPRQAEFHEDASARAFRLTEKLRGILKEELAEYGGAEGFMRWIRSDDDEEAA